MRTTAKQSSWGPAVGEEFNFLFFDTATNDPIYIQEFLIRIPTITFIEKRPTFLFLNTLFPVKVISKQQGKNMKSKRETYIASNRGKGILIIRTKKTPIKKFGSICIVISQEAYSADLKYPVKSYFPTVIAVNTLTKFSPFAVFQETAASFVTEFSLFFSISCVLLPTLLNSNANKFISPILHFQ